MRHVATEFHQTQQKLSIINSLARTSTKRLRGRIMSILENKVNTQHQQSAFQTEKNYISHGITEIAYIL